MAEEPMPIQEILKRAFQVELDGLTFYAMAAERSDRPAVERLFKRLARDEVEHQNYIKNVMRRYEELGLGSFTIDPHDPDLGEYSSQVFTDEFRAQAAGAATELGALSIGMQLENNAITFFSGRAQSADDAQVKGFFRFLADWEGQHYRILQRLFEAVRGDFTLDER